MKSQTRSPSAGPRPVVVRCPSGRQRGPGARCTRMCAHTHAHIHAGAHIHAHMCAHMHTRTCTCTRTCTHVHTHTHKCVRTYMCMHTRTRTHVHPHAHVHTHTRTPAGLLTHLAEHGRQAPRGGNRWHLAQRTRAEGLGQRCIRKFPEEPVDPTDVSLLNLRRNLCS